MKIPETQSERLNELIARDGVPDEELIAFFEEEGEVKWNAKLQKFEETSDI